MRQFIRSTFRWFGTASQKSKTETTKLSLVEEMPPVIVQIAPTAEPVVLMLEPDPKPTAESRKESTEESTNEVAEVIAPPAPAVQVYIRGSRHYSTCPHCEASWALRDRFFDPRTGRAYNKREISCPTCTKPVSIPETLSLNTIR